jgi:hypothetical protein
VKAVLGRHCESREQVRAVPAEANSGR